MNSASTMALGEHSGADGLQENRSDGAPSAYLPSNRQTAILGAIRRDGLGLEIGPSHSPLAPKRAGFNVHVLDHASADELRAKYAGHRVDIDNIEEVDFVWRGEPLPQLVGREACYDWIIASHVIEHTPDFVGFLIQCERLLSPDGVLALAIPDKRYCFDTYQVPTSTGDVLDAHHQQRTRATPGKLFDHVANAAWLSPGGAIAWDPGNMSEVALLHTFDDARSAWSRAQTSPDYVDVHNWRFTPSRFLLVLQDLRALGLISLGVVDAPTWNGCEFYQVLRRTEQPLMFDRRELLERCRREVR
ncbi:MAG TPA: methyltransferase domain-containing protein [Dokdonella sp.]